MCILILKLIILSYTILIAAVILGHFPRSKLVYLGIARNKLTGKRNNVAGAEAERWNNLWLHIQVSVFRQSTRAFSRVGYCKHPWPVNQHNVHHSKLRNRHQRLLRTKCSTRLDREPRKWRPFIRCLLAWAHLSCADGPKDGTQQPRLRWGETWKVQARW